jgi:RNA polymerase sigma-70 factor, ECF subfamily
MSALSRAETMPAREVSVETLFRAHAAEVARWAGWFGHRSVDADDVVQEVFLIVRRRLARFRGDNFRPWLFQITRKVIANQRRRTWFRRLWTHTTPIPDPAIPTEQWPDAPIESRERVERLHQMLRALPDRERQVVILFELEELSGAQIAALLGLPASTIRVWLHRARARLANRVGRLLAEEDA